MPSVFFEDFQIGAVREYGASEVTKDAIVEFAGEFDPQPFHLDEEAGRHSLLGGLAASGWHTASISMRINVDHLLADAACLGSPGIEELRWLKPVRPGDVLRVRSEVLNARESRSRPDMGLVQFRFGVVDQNDQEVMWYRSQIMFGRRGAAPAQPRPPVAAAALPESLPAFDIDFSSIPDDSGLLTGWLDDIVVGYRVETGPYEFTRENILRFARAFDPQVFHIDEDAARQTRFGALAASGWHTAGAAMARLVATRDAYAAEARRRNLPPTPKGPSPGFRDLKWLKPVYIGDVVSFSTTALETRSISRHGWGIAFHRNEGINQNGEKVFEYTSSSLWPTRV